MIRVVLRVSMLAKSWKVTREPKDRAAIGLGISRRNDVRVHPQGEATGSHRKLRAPPIALRDRRLWRNATSHETPEGASTEAGDGSRNNATPAPRRRAPLFWLRKPPPAPESEIDANLARKSTTNVRATSTQHFPAVTAGSENHNQGIETRRNQVRARIALVPCGYPEPGDCHPLYRDVYAAPHVCVDRGPDGFGFALARGSIRVDRRRSGRHGHAARDGDHSRDHRCTPGDCHTLARASAHRTRRRIAAPSGLAGAALMSIASSLCRIPRHSGKREYDQKRVEDRGGRELRRAGEGRRRHRDGGRRPHVGFDREQAERGAEEDRRERERQRRADAVPGSEDTPRRYRERRGRPWRAAPSRWSSYGSRVMRFSGGGAIGECAMK